MRKQTAHLRRAEEPDRDDPNPFVTFCKYTGADEPVYDDPEDVTCGACLKAGAEFGRACLAQAYVLGQFTDAKHGAP